MKQCGGLVGAEGKVLMAWAALAGAVASSVLSGSQGGKQGADGGFNSAGHVGDAPGQTTGPDFPIDVAQQEANTPPQPRVNGKPLTTSLAQISENTQQTSAEASCQTPGHDATHANIWNT